MLKKSKKIYLMVAVLLFTSSISFAEGYNYQNINYNASYSQNNTISYKLNYTGNSNTTGTYYWVYTTPVYNYNYTRPVVVVPSTPTVPTKPVVPSTPTVPSTPIAPSTPAVPSTPTVPSTPIVPTKPAVPVTPTQPTQNTAGLSAEESEVVRLVNIERQKAGLSPFTASSELSNVARAKSQDMATNNYFSHTSPTYGSPFEMMKQFGIKYSTAGENIARGQATAQSVVTGWMNSPGHRANILNASFNKIGVGAVKSSSNGIYWTQMFTN